MTINDLYEKAIDISTRNAKMRGRMALAAFDAGDMLVALGMRDMMLGEAKFLLDHNQNFHGKMFEWIGEIIFNPEDREEVEAFLNEEEVSE